MDSFEADGAPWDIPTHRSFRNWPSDDPSIHKANPGAGAADKRGALTLHLHSTRSAMGKVLSHSITPFSWGGQWKELNLPSGTSPIVSAGFAHRHTDTTCNHMKKMLNCVLLAASLPLLASSASGALLWMDNFNAPDTNNFDGAVITGRLSGSEAGNTALSSFGFQQSISNNQLLLPQGGNGVRFGGQFTRYDWAAGASGSAILAGGGFTVSFDWIPADNTDGEWMSFQVGTVNDDNGNLTNDDYGILFRNNGGTERFRNAPAPTGNQGAGSPFAATPGGVARQVEITYSFSSFADGSPVTATSRVNGFQVASDTFNWDGNAGSMRMELGNGVANTRIDNLRIATVPEPTGAVLLSASLGLMALRRRRA